MATCPNCGSSNPGGAAFCCGCGSKLPPQASEAPRATVVCPHCNVQNPSGSTFCYSCSNPLYGNSANPLPPSGHYDSRTVQYNPYELPVGARVTSIIAMVLGIVSCCSCYMGWMFSIPALIVASISRGRTPPDVENPKANVATITGAIGIGLSVLSFIILLAAAS